MVKKTKKIKCEICGFDRAVERCHIVPLRIIKLMVGYTKKGGWNKERWKSYKGKNVLTLCKNCHYLYDNFKLTEKEFDRIKDKVGVILKDFEGIISFLLEEELINGELTELFTNWVNKQSKWLNRLYGK